MALLDISDGHAMQIALSLGGILVMIVAAILLNSIRIKSRRQPRRDVALEHDDFRLARSPNFEVVGAFFRREGSENYANSQMGRPLAGDVRIGSHAADVTAASRFFGLGP
jgi:hypothetical protein